MIICRSKGFIFLRVPRTASTSISEQLYKNIVFDKELDAYSGIDDHVSFNVPDSEKTNQHPTLKHFLRLKIITETDLKQLRVFGVLREPIERTLSLFSYMLKEFDQIDIKSFSKNNILEKGLELFHNSPRKFFNSRILINSNSKTSMQYFPLLPQSNWLLHEQKPISDIIVYPNFAKFLNQYSGVSSPTFNSNVGTKFHAKEKLSSHYISELKKIYPQDFELWDKYSNFS